MVSLESFGNSWENSYIYTMFITNNHISFHLWLKKNFVKHQKVSKYYDQDCSAAWRLMQKKIEQRKTSNYCIVHHNYKRLFWCWLSVLGFSGHLNFFPPWSQCLQNISFRTNFSLLCLGISTETNAPCQFL